MNRTQTLRTALTLLIVALVVLSAVPAPVAAETRTGGTVVVGGDETLNEDLTVLGGSVVVRGTVNGDVTALGGTVVVDGTVTGDVSVASGSLTIQRGATVGGDVSAGAGSVVVDGTVEGSVSVGAETIRLGPEASIGGDLRYDGRLDRAAGASVGGSVVRERMGGFGPVSGVGDAVFDVYGFLVNVVVGVLLLVLLPGISRRVADTVATDPLRTGAVGLLALFGIPIALVLIAITILGIPLAIAGSILFVLVAWIGFVYGRYAVGEWILGQFDVDNRYAALLVGMVVVAVAVRLPLVGWVVSLAVFVLGLGAFLLAVTNRTRTTPPTTGQAEGEERSRPTA